MKETKFIEQNKEKWLKFEQLLRLNKRDPDKLGDLYIQITDDLSYARTNYPNRSIRIYLNNLAQQLFYHIYKNKKEGRNKFVNFWKQDLPSVVFHSRYELITALVVFLLSAAIGVVSSIYDPEFARSILGSEYVDMTLKNIEDGDPMGVYKSSGEMDMMFRITLNNLWVAFRTFVMGVLFSLGAIIILVYNGIMVGTFQFFFIQRDLGIESFLSIWLHGTLEISSIVIAGGAGVVLGRGFVFPGTHSRLRAFQVSARRGLKLFIGIVPILVFAALIESFVTRYTDLPDIVKLSLILASLFFILAYFVWLPYTKYRNGTLNDVEKEYFHSRNLQVPDAGQGKIRKVNEVFRDAVMIYGKIISKYIGPAILSAVIYLGAVGYILYDKVDNQVININSWFFPKFLLLLDYLEYPLLYVSNTILLTVILYLISRAASSYLKIESKAGLLIVNCLLASAISNLPLFLDGIFGFLLWGVTFIASIYALFVSLVEGKNYFSSIFELPRLFSKVLGRLLGLFGLLVFISLAYFLITDSPFFAFYMQFVNSNFMLDPETTYVVGLVLNGLVLVLGIILTVPLIFISFGFQYYTFKEIQEASWLKQTILQFNGKESI